MEYVLAALPSIISGTTMLVIGIVVGVARTKAAQLKATHDGVTDGMLSLLRDRLLQSCRHWQTLGYIDKDEAANIEAMFAAYKAMGGNGFVKKQVERTLALPLEWEKHIKIGGTD